MSDPNGPDILDLKPDDTPDYMIPAWIGCIHWALGEAGLVAQFRADTGNQWTPAADGLGKMIDAATGADLAFVRAFVVWANEHVWGPMDGSEETGGAGWEQPSTFKAWHYYTADGRPKCGDVRLTIQEPRGVRVQKITAGMRACRRCVALLGLEETEGAKG